MGSFSDVTEAEDRDAIKKAFDARTELAEQDLGGVRRYTRREVWCVIPARIGSTRLPRKMLLDRTGKPLIRHTALNALRYPGFERVIIATDSLEVAEAVRGLEGVVPILTSNDLEIRNGTERIAYLLEATQPHFRQPELIVNIQGDEPEVPHEALDGLIFGALMMPFVDAATIIGPLNPADKKNPNVVKAIARTSIDGVAVEDFRRTVEPDETAFHHFGVYAYRPETLRWYLKSGPSGREELRRLEQMRILDRGGRMRAFYTQAALPGIDDDEAYERFVQRVRGKEGEP